MEKIRSFYGHNMLLNKDSYKIEKGIYCRGCEIGHSKANTDWIQCCICNRIYCNDHLDNSYYQCEQCGNYYCCKVKMIDAVGFMVCENCYEEPDTIQLPKKTILSKTDELNSESE